MQRLIKALATVAGVGYLPKAPGTAGSLVGLVLGLFVAPPLKSPLSAGYLLGMVSTFLLSVAVATQAERAFGTIDPACIVIDECWSMWAIMVIVPWLRYSLPLAAVAFGVFRFFDVVKPFPLRHLAKLPGGWGIMCDDAGAAFYTLVVFWIALRIIRLPA